MKKTTWIYGIILAWVLVGSGYCMQTIDRSQQRVIQREELKARQEIVQELWQCALNTGQYDNGVRKDNWVWKSPARVSDLIDQARQAHCLEKVLFLKGGVFGGTALHHAMQRQSSEVVLLLLSAAREVHMLHHFVCAQNEDGGLAYHWLSCDQVCLLHFLDAAGEAKALRKVLLAGDKNGKTILHYCCDDWQHSVDLAIVIKIAQRARVCKSLLLKTTKSHWSVLYQATFSLAKSYVIKTLLNAAREFGVLKELVSMRALDYGATVLQDIMRRLSYAPTDLDRQEVVTIISGAAREVGMFEQMQQWDKEAEERRLSVVYGKASYRDVVWRPEEA